MNFVGVLLNNGAVRGLKTCFVRNATRSSPATPGYASEDKILQMKQHQNDYAKQYPSVTLILNKTMTEESRNALEKWKQERIAEMGEEEFNRFYEGEFSMIFYFNNGFFYTSTQWAIAFISITRHITQDCPCYLISLR